MTDDPGYRRDRHIDLEVVVSGTPEQVWDAIATGPGVTAWMQPTDIEPRPGGRYAFDLQDGSGPNETGTVSEYERPHRFATSGVHWTVAGDDAPAQLATEWIIETHRGGTLVVRMVMSGFGHGQDWDDEIGGMQARLRIALHQLRHYLETIRTTKGPRMPVMQVLAVIPVTDFDAGRSWWERLLGAPGEQPMPGEDVVEWHLTDTGGIQLVRDAERSGTAQLTLVVNDLQAEARALADRGITLGAISTTLDVSTALVCDDHGNHVVVAQSLQPAS